MSLFDFGDTVEEISRRVLKKNNKNERGWAQEAEIDVTDAINGHKKSTSIEKIAVAIRNRVNDYYPNQTINSAMWIGGGTYKNAGDIRLNLTDYSVSIEMKCSKENGRGTSRNLSTMIFPRQISSDLVSYQHYDAHSGYRRKRFELVEQITGNYPVNDAEYARNLRRFRLDQPDVIEQIEQITSPGQIEYARMATIILNDNLGAVNRMIQRDVLHIDPSSKEVWLCIVKNFETFIQTVNFIDFINDNMVTRVVSVGKTIKFQNARGRDVVRFAVHWKNICQGGITPCFNVFLGNEY
jgi:hypothetical protein